MRDANTALHLRIEPPELPAHARGWSVGASGDVAEQALILRPLQFLAIVFTALALVPAGAHLFALPNKMALAQEQYFVAQSIYRGWALFGFVLIPAMLLNLGLALLLRGRGTPFSLALAAGVCLALVLAVFFIWTYPANQATENWTTVPVDWEALRLQWEYSHAANALVTFAALCLVTLSVLTARD
jgi:hypothetical protein